MKKRHCGFLLLIFSAIMFSSCGKGREEKGEKNPSVLSLTEESSQSIENTDESEEENMQETPEDSPEERGEPSTEENEGSKEETGGTQMQEFVIEIDGERFPATLYDNETTHALMERLPMTLDMEELHGNEKFNYLDQGLPTNPENVGTSEQEILCCLVPTVLFCSTMISTLPTAIQESVISKTRMLLSMNSQVVR